MLLVIIILPLISAIVIGLFGRFLGRSAVSVFSISVLLLSNTISILYFFLGLEGVGFCSYLLINFWFTRIQANKAALKALLVNRFGDVILLFGICLVANKYHSLDFIIMKNLTQYIVNEAVIIGDLSI